MDPTLKQILTALVEAHRAIDQYRTEQAALLARVAELEASVGDPDQPH